MTPKKVDDNSDLIRQNNTLKEQVEALEEIVGLTVKVVESGHKYINTLHTALLLMAFVSVLLVAVAVVALIK